MATNEPTRFQSSVLRAFCVRTFTHFGVPEDEAGVAAEVLARADLRGIDSHGVARLRTYVDMLTLGRINPRPRPSIVRASPSTATFDGDNGLGLVVGPRANALAIEKALAVGSGWVTVRNTNHFGIAGWYSMQALERGCIGIAMTNSTKLVAPFHGGERMLGTNPIAIAFPGHEEPPIVIDMATSATAYGKIEIAKRRGEPIPKGWAIDADGNPTDDPDGMIQGGAMLPLGSVAELSGHKGYALAAMVDLLTCVLSGANWGPFAPPFALRQEIPKRSVGKGIGHFFGALRIDAFIDPEEFRRQVDDWIRTFRATKPMPGTEGVRIPGDPEREAEADRSVNGIPLIEPVIRDLEEIGKTIGVPFPA